MAEVKLRLITPCGYYAYDKEIRDTWGCGPGGIGDCFVPDTVYGLSVKRACKRHDFRYRFRVDKTEETRLEDDNEFLWKLRHRESLFRGKCAECRFLEICRGGSRSRALAVYDDFSAPDPSCYLTEEEIAEPVHEEARHD